MDPTQAFLLLVGVPIVAWAIAVLMLRGLYQDVQREWASRGQAPPFARILVVGIYGAVPMLFGLSMWFLSLSFLSRLTALTTPAALDAQNLFLWGSVASAAAGCCTIAGQTIVVRGRISSVLGSDFGRVLPISVIPFTDSVFALFLVFLTFGYIDGFVEGGLAASTSAVGSAVSALQAYAVAGLAIPVAAAVSNRVRDLSARGFGRALMIADMGELPIVLGLVIGFLALRGLSAP